MTLLLELALLLICCVSVYLFNRRKVWRGQPVNYSELVYWTHRNRNKEGLTHFWVAVDVIEAIDFEIRCENKMDRLMKRSGLVREIQTGDPLFDDKLYLASDDPRFKRLLLQHTETKDLIRSLFAKGVGSTVKVTQLNCRQGKLWAVVEAIMHAPMSELESDFAKDLQQIALRLNQTVTDCSVSRRPSRTRLVTTALIVISSALLVNGLLQLLLIAWATYPIILDQSALLWDSLWLGGGILAILVLLVFGELWRTSKAHLVLLHVLLVGGAGCFSSAYIELRAINIAMDNKPASIVIGSVRSLQETRSRRSHRYYLHTTFEAEDYFRQRLRVDRLTFANSYKGQPVRFTLREGRLGYRWIESITLARQN